MDIDKHTSKLMKELGVTKEQLEQCERKQVRKTQTIFLTDIIGDYENRTIKLPEYFPENGFLTIEAFVEHEYGGYGYAEISSKVTYYTEETDNELINRVLANARRKKTLAEKNKDKKKEKMAQEAAEKARRAILGDAKIAEAEKAYKEAYEKILKEK